MVSLADRRRGAKYLEGANAVSERRACQVVGIARSTKRRLSGRIEEIALLSEIHALSEHYPRFGYRKIFDRLKTVTQGYGSFDYEMLDYRETKIVKVDILVNGETVDALSQLVHVDKARPRALHYCERLAENIPKQQFKIAIQGVIGGNIIARTTINAYRKDVTARCYGGDITRKRKLLEKQKEGKKRMKMVGAVEIPQSAFVAVLKTDES